MRIKPKRTEWNYLMIAVVVGSCYLSAELFRKTIVDLKFLIMVILVAGILSFVIEQSNCFTNRLPTINFLKLTKNIFSWGLITGCLFLALNFTMHSKVVQKTKFQLLAGVEINREKGALKNIMVKIDYQNKVKKLKFHKQYYAERHEYKSVTLDVAKGLFGFDVIKKQTLNY